MTLIDLLVDGASRAKDVLEGYEPAMTKEAYVAFMRSLAQDVTWTGEKT